MSSISRTDSQRGTPLHSGSSDSATHASDRRVQQVALRLTPISDQVAEVELNVPAGRVVEEISFNVPVSEQEEAERSLHEQPSHSDLEFKIKRLPKSNVALYNAYGRGKGLYFGLKDKHQDMLNGIFHQIKAYCLEKGEMPEDAQGFTINWSKRFIRFFDPSINQLRVLDLEKILQENPDIAEKAFEAELILDNKIFGGLIRVSHFSPDNKGSTDGGKTLIRSDAILQSLPRSIGEAPYQLALNVVNQIFKDDAERDGAIKRMGSVETLLKNMEDTLIAKKTALTEQNKDEKDPAKKGELQKKIAQIEASLQQLKQVDTFALYAALACYPQQETSVRGVSQRAEFLKRATESLTNQLGQLASKQQVARPWIPDLPLIRGLRGERPVSTSRFYPIDVGGLMFTGLPAGEARMGYVQYCQAQGMMVKSEGIEDALFRYALKSDKENRGLDALTRHVIDEEIKREIATAMQAAVESREAQEKLTLSGTDLKSRIASFRQQAGLIN